MTLGTKSNALIVKDGVLAVGCGCCSTSRCCYEEIRAGNPDGTSRYRCRLQYRSIDRANVGFDLLGVSHQLSGCDGRFPDVTEVRVGLTCCGDPDRYDLTNSPWRDSYCGTNPAAWPLKTFLFVSVIANSYAPCRIVYFYPVDCDAQLGATVVYSSPAGTYSDFSGCRSIAPVSCFPYVIPSSAPPVLTVSPNPLP